jgi:hypothetical protein
VVKNKAERRGASEKKMELFSCTVWTGSERRVESSEIRWEFTFYNAVSGSSFDISAAARHDALTCLRAWHLSRRPFPSHYRGVIIGLSSLMFYKEVHNKAASGLSSFLAKHAEKVPL